MTARVAVLDDEQRMVDVLRMMLSRDGYEVEGFVRSDDALEAIAERPVDVLITDLRMPGPDGLEVLRRARAVVPDLPVILVTAHATVQTAIAALREGAFDYVEKPFDNDALKTLVRRAVDLGRLGRENRYLRAELRSRYAPDRIAALSATTRSGA